MNLLAGNDAMVIVMKTVMGREAFSGKAHHAPASYTLLVQQEDYAEKDLYDMTSQVLFVMLRIK